MKIIDACRAVIQARESQAPQAVLVSTMSAMFAFDALQESRRRIDSVPLMGGTAGLALGLALAKPALPVIAVDGDASLLMELGGLVTVASAQPRHLIHILVNNGVQFGGAVNMTRPGAGGIHCEFHAMARAAGYPNARRVDDAREFADELAQLLSEPQLAFIEVVVEPDAPTIGAERRQPFMPDRQFERMRDAVVALREDLGREP
jgi:phosphonopyruvate decarboxylase